MSSPELSRDPVCLCRNVQAVSISLARARVCRERHPVLLGSTGAPCVEALLPSEAGAMLPTVQIRALETTLGARVPRERSTWCLLLGQECTAIGFHLLQSLH